MHRYFTSFENGHQLRMVNRLLSKAQDGEGIKLGKRLWGIAQETSKDDEGKGKGGSPPQP